MTTIVVLILAGCFAAGLVHVALGLIPAEDFWEMYWFAVRISVGIGLGAGLASYLYESLRTELERTQLELRSRQLDEERARKLLDQAQLSSLESRIHPHFLFNTLNSIASLIPEDPKRAEDMIGKLAALLRFSLEAHQRPLVPLRQELKIVRDYLEIESARLGPRLRYSIDVPTELEEIELPPLAVELLVENSIKHAIAPRREGGEVRVRARAAGGRLEVEVLDTGPGFALDSVPPGHGLDNLQGRLRVLYGPGGAGIETSSRDGFSSVRIRLKV